VIILTVFLVLVLAVSLADRLAPQFFAHWALRLERTLSGLHLRQVQVAGFAMPYLEGGQGQPLVLIHGFAGDKDNFTRVARHLVAHYRVIIPDLPGFGDAGRDPQAKYNMAEQVARVHALLQQLGLSQVDLGGSSMGGFIATRFAATYPHMVGSVWLLDPAGTEAAAQSLVLQQYLATGEMPLLLQNEAAFPDMMRQTMHKPPFIPYSLRHVLAQRAVKDFALHSAIMSEIRDEAMLETQFHDLPTPALIVWGERDLILDPRGAQAMAKLFVQAKVIMMADIGHLPMLEAPRTSARDYLAFRKSLQAPSIRA
jgi:triacylglycerol lipase